MPCSVQDLLDQVRRHLWQRQFVNAARRALHVSALLLLLGVALQLLGPGVRGLGLVWAVASIGAASMAYAAWRRPGLVDSALWADRHLGGASAFGTWLDSRHQRLSVADTQALAHLQSWAQARVPEAQHRLLRAVEPARLWRPLLALAICAVLAAIVFALPDAAPAASGQGPASGALGAASRPFAPADASGPTEPAEDLAKTARQAQRDAAKKHAAPQGNPAAGAAAQADDGAPPAAAQRSATAAATSTVRPASTAATAAATPDTAVAQTRSPSSGAGREAGDSRDERADVGVSRALPATIGMPRSAGRALRGTGPQQADMNQGADYDDALAPAARAAPSAGLAAAAATPPAATATTRLTHSEADYVQAWMKASPRQR